MKITVLKEWNFSVDRSKTFTPLNEENADKGLRMAVQPFLIETGGAYILLDAGLGWMQDGKSVQERLLEEAGLDPGQISKILLSHLHKDHVDGIFRSAEEDYALRFPNAQIYLQKREMDFAMKQKGNVSYHFELLEKLAALDNVSWMEEDEGSITEEVSFEVTGGHTPFHQVFWIRDEQETYFYGADDLPQRGYLDYEIAYKTDHNGKKARDLRKKWNQEAREQSWKILLYHDMKVPVLELDNV